MDPRLEHRRRRVAEDRARTNLGRLVKLLVLVAVVAGLVWFAQSPFLSVGRISVTGADRVDVGAALTDHDVVEGKPMLLLDTDGVEATLLADPWVAEAEVARDWPTTVAVVIVERVPAATTQFSDGWWLVAVDGTVLAETDAPDPALGIAEFPALTAEEAGGDLAVAGAVVFLDALPRGRREGAVVRQTDEGLEAVLGGYLVRLGRPFDMEQKADVSLAIINEGLEEGSIITVVAPASPAVLAPGAANPDGEGDGEDEDDSGVATPPTTKP